MANNYFQFKQFLINQGNCAMKVGTDSVLLASLCKVNNHEFALDIGTGTGILALMLAQRNANLQIDAIEIDEQAFLQAKENVAASNFTNQIQVYFSALQSFNANKKYDLIITNPPYFIGKNNYSITDLQRAKARHDNDLPFEELINYVVIYLNENGKFVLILPSNEAAIFKNLALKNGLFIQQSIYLKPKENKQSNRVIMEFAKQQKEEIVEEYIIYNLDNSPSEFYKDLTKDFYL